VSQEIARLHATVGADTNELHSKLNEASRGIDTFRRETESAGSGIQSFFDRVASTAGGVIAANLFGQLTNQVTNFVKSAIAATAELQYTEIGITGLLAREISKGELVTETYQVMTQAAGGQAGANKKLMASQESLTGKVADYTYHLALAQQKEVELGGKKKVSVSQTMAVQHAVETYTQKLQGAQKELGGVTEKLTDHAAATYAVSTATREMYINQTTISEAYPIAQARAKELMNELARLAIVSPYQVEMVNSTFKLAMTFGYSSKEAMTFTKAILNVAAGTGATNEMLHRMAYNFAQIRLVGKVTAMDMRQLAMAGFDLNGVLQFTGEKFGIVINDYADFNKAIASGKITWQQFTEAFAEYADVNFGGASERMATTLTGLQSTFNDIFMLTMPQVIRPALEVVNQRLTDMLNIFLDVRDSGVLEDVGAQLGKTVTRWMAPIDTVLKSVTRFRDIQSQLKIPNLLPDLQHQLGGEMAALSGGGGMVGVLAKAIFGDETGGKIVTGIKWVKTHLQDIKAVVIGFGTVFAGLKIAGIVGSLITTFGALASPIALLITLSGLLVAAYIRDWGGIRTAVNGFWEKTGKPVFTQIVDWAKIKIPEAMKGIREKWDELVTWASDFWGRIKSAYQAEGAQGVIDVVWVEAQKIGGEIIRGIRSKIDEMWPIVSAKFSEWGTQIPAMIQSWWKGTEVPGEFGMIKTPGMEEKIVTMGNQLGEWLVQGMTDFSKWAEQIATSFKEWATSEPVKTGATTAGTDVGNLLMDAVDALIGSEGTQTTTSLAFKNHLLAAAETAGEATAELFQKFDEGFTKAVFKKTFGLSEEQLDEVNRISAKSLEKKGGGFIMGLEESPVVTAAIVAAANKHGGLFMEVMEENLADIGENWNTSSLNTAAKTAGTDAGSSLIDALIASGDIKTSNELVAAADRWAALIQATLDKHPINFNINAPGMQEFLKERTGGQYGQSVPGAPGLANGADFIARIPQLIRVGEGKYPERVTVTPLTGWGRSGQPIINVYIQGPVTQPQQAREQAKIGVLEGLRARGLA
jgi:tape measure domain-containing protein